MKKNTLGCSKNGSEFYPVQKELPYSWKKNFAQIIFERNIYNKMILNFGQTDLCFSASNKTTFVQQVEETVNSKY